METRIRAVGFSDQIKIFCLHSLPWSDGMRYLPNRENSPHATYYVCVIISYYVLGFFRAQCLSLCFSCQAAMLAGLPC